MKLQQLFSMFEWKVNSSVPDAVGESEVTDICFDARAVVKNAVFIAAGRNGYIGSSGRLYFWRFIPFFRGRKKYSL